MLEFILIYPSCIAELRFRLRISALMFGIPEFKNYDEIHAFHANLHSFGSGRFWPNPSVLIRLFSLNGAIMGVLRCLSFYHTLIFIKEIKRLLTFQFGLYKLFCVFLITRAIFVSYNRYVLRRWRLNFLAALL